METKTVLELSHIKKSFPDGRGRGERLVLDDINLSLNAGEFAVIVGPSGCGKSTLLNIAGMMLSPDSGLAKINGQETAGMSKGKSAKLRRDKIGFVFQNHNLIPYLKGYEQLSLVGKMPKEEADSLMRDLELDEVKNQYPDSMSGGERQRFAVARAFAGNPDLIIADEPTASLDSRRGYKIVEMIREETHRRGKAAIMVTHDERVLKLADTVYRMEDGRLKREEVLQ